MGRGRIHFQCLTKLYYVMIDDIRALKFSSDEPQALSCVDGRLHQLGSANDWSGSLEYSYDGKEWNAFDPRVSVVSFGGWKQPSVYLRGSNENLYDAMRNEYGERVGLAFRFASDAPVRCEGSVMNLLDKDLDLNSAPAKCFSHLFDGCRQLVRAPELPAMHLEGNCYESMFRGCSLVNAPGLPSTDLASGCYSGMFAGNDSLREAPALPSQELKPDCYKGMFSGCGGLRKGPVLPAQDTAPDCYSGMFENCVRLKEIPSLKARSLSEGCYERMFAGCTGLREVSSLPAVRGRFNSCAEMFAGCTGLEKVSSVALKDVNDFENVCCGMFSGCSALESLKDVDAEKASMEQMKDRHPGLFNAGLRRKLNSYVHFCMLRDMGVSPEQSFEMSCRKFHCKHTELADNIKEARRNGYATGEDVSFARDYARNWNNKFHGKVLSEPPRGNRV